MQQEVILSLVIKYLDEKLAEMQLSRGPMGPRGFKGLDGENGKDFYFEEHREEITSIIKEASLKFSDLSEEELLSLKGPKGDDGKPFSFEEHRETIYEMVKDSALRFKDLTEDEIESLRGPRGLSGRDGRDGRDGEDGEGFSFEDHREEIAEILNSYLNEHKDSFKIKFSDLTDDEKVSLRGPRGQRGKEGIPGKDGKDFVFSEHKDFFQSLKLKFSDFTEDEKAELKLKFEHLTEEEKVSLRGPRGQRGKVGPQGTQGASSKWSTGEGPPQILGSSGDMYLDKLTGDVYIWE